MVASMCQDRFNTSSEEYGNITYLIALKVMRGKDELKTYVSIRLDSIKMCVNKSKNHSKLCQTY